MNDDDVLRLRRRLEARAAMLRDELRLVDAEVDGAPSSIVRSQVEDLADLGEQRDRGAVRHAERERDVRELRDIAAALERLADGRGGVCIDCEGTIAPARLEAEPAAARCIECQERFERVHGVGARVPPVI